MRYLLLIILLAPQLNAQSLRLLSFGGNSSTTSTELVILLEDVAQNSNGTVKILSTKEAIGYRKKSSYLILEEVGEILKKEELEKLFSSAKKSERYTVFESARAYMFLPPGMPAAFVELLKSKKDSVSTLNSNVRYWGDLKSYAATGAVTDKVQKYELKENSAQGDREWKVAPYMEYEIQYAERPYKVRVIPKSYGGLSRIISALDSQANADSLMISTGGFMGDDMERYGLLEDFFGRHKNAFVVANSAEIKNAGHDKLDGRLKNLQSRVISANVCAGRDKECSLLFKPYVSLKVNGLKVAVIGITSPEGQSEIDSDSITITKLKNFIIKTPGALELKNLVLKLRPAHDLIILATSMDATAIEKHLWDVIGADFVILRGNRKFNWNDESTTVIRDFKNRFPLHPMQSFDVGSTNFLKTDFLFTGADIKFNTKKIIYDQTLYSGDEINDVYPQAFIAAFYKKQFVLPDHRVLYPDKLLASKMEFAKMCARLLTDGFNGEVGLCHMQNQNSTVIGNQDETGVRTWLRQNDRVQVIYLTGSELKALRNRNQNLADEEKLVFAGISDEEKIKGLAVRDSELYRVVLPQTVAISPVYQISSQHRVDKFTKLDSGEFTDDENGYTIGLADFVISELKKHWAVYEKDEESKKGQIETYRRLFEGKDIKPIPGYWTHNLDHLSIEYSQLTTTDASAFSGVTDSRLNTVDQRYVAASINYKASYNRYPFLNELGLTSRYSKQELFPVGAATITNIMDDQLRLFGNISVPVFNLQNYQWLGRDYGPFVEVAYETEYEPNPPLGLQRVWDGLAGVKFFNGDFFKSASAALMTNRYLTEPDTRNVFGFNLKLEAAKKILNNQAEYKLTSDYRYFFDDDSAVADLRSRFILDQSLNLTVVRKVSFGPYLRYFSLSRKSTGDTVDQTIIGVNLTYSDFWKPMYGTP